MSKGGRVPGWVQCNADIPTSLAEALAAHLEITQVPKQDFISLAIRNEVLRQRSLGLGLRNGKVPPLRTLTTSSSPRSPCSEASSSTAASE